jgi:hypothetical protein
MSLLDKSKDKEKQQQADQDNAKVDLVEKAKENKELSKENATKPLVTKDENGNDVIVQGPIPSEGEMKQDGSDTISTSKLPPEANISQAPKSDEFYYSCPLSESYSIHLNNGEVRAKNGVLKVNKKQHEEIQNLIKSGRPDIAQNAVLLDRNAAEQFARAHIERQRQAASRGVSSSATAEAAHNVRFGRDPQNVGPGERGVINLDVIETDAVHAEDSSLDPDKKGA